MTPTPRNYRHLTIGNVCHRMACLSPNIKPSFHYPAFIRVHVSHGCFLDDIIRLHGRQRSPGDMKMDIKQTLRIIPFIFDEVSYD